MKKDMTFEQAMLRLEEILKALEGGEGELAKSLALYEEGVALAAHCSGLLTKAEQKVVMLQKSADGVCETDFSPREDA